MVVYTGAVATLSCCDIFGNAKGDLVAGTAGQFSSDGNTSENPLFCDAGNGDYTLSDGSLCAAEDNPECGQIGAFGLGGCGTGVDEEMLPSRFLLYPSAPNPFRHNSTITYFALSGGARLLVRVYNLKGQTVKTLLDASVERGYGHLDWDGRDDSGRPVSSGVYSCRALLGTEESRAKLVPMR